MPNDNTSVTVKLLDREYRFSCEADERTELLEAARLLDEKMQDIRRSQVVGLDRIAVMAALNMSHESLLANRELAEYKSRDERLSRLSEQADREIRAFNEYRNDLL